MNINATLMINKADLLQGLDKAISDYKMAALTKKGSQPIYDYVTSSKDIELTYQPTVLSPKKFFFPQDEVLVEYTDEGKVTAKIDAEPLVLFGVRPCDLHGIKLLDEAFADSNGDPNYLAKREQAVIIGMDCHNVCDQHAFCYRVKANEVDTGFDAMLYELDNDTYAITIASDKGKAFVAKYFDTEALDKAEIEKYIAKKEAGFAGKKPWKDLDSLPDIMQQNKEHKVWDEEGAKCLSCGSCIMVCPTCYCFDVADELALSLNKGERIRRWDACMLSSFAEVAGGENFREHAKNRLHHRIGRKFDYLMRKHNQSVCVGCGRCVRACLANISPKHIAEEITGDKE